MVGKIPPERVLRPFEIRTYNATDIGTLIRGLGPVATSIQGGEESPPIVLLNGQRVSSFADIARIPTEAIGRMEVFPEALALAYGYRPNQKVVNVVTFERFSRRTGEINLAIPTEGGRTDTEFSGGFLRIRDNTRFNIDATYRGAGALLESERNLQSPEGSPGLGDFRTLLPDSQRLSLNGTLSRPLSSNMSATLNTRFTSERNTFLFGLQSQTPLEREIDSNAFHIGVVLNGRRERWIWTLAATLDRTETEILSQAGGTRSSPDRAAFTSTLADADFVVGGPLVTLPAGPATVSLRAGVGTLNFASVSAQKGPETELQRNRLSVQGSLDVPIMGTRARPSWLGVLSANANVAVARLSDAGLLETYGAGLNWSPVAALKIYASLTSEERAPSVEQLGAPQLLTPGLRVYDPLRGETVDVTRISGGNSLLRPEARREFSLGLYSKPFSETDLGLSLNYVDARVDFPISTINVGSSDFEFVFPERFLRDLQGRLQLIDARPVNFRSARQRILRSGISFSRQLTKGPPPPQGTFYSNVTVYPSEAAMRASLPPGTVVVEAAPGSEDARRIESLSSRYTIALYHTWNITNELTAPMGGPTFDLLEGFATDIQGVPPRHQLSFQAGVFQSWFGARLTVDWRSKAAARSFSPAPTSPNPDLTLSDFTTVNFSLFANPAERLGGASAPGWIKGTRIGLSITNLFNTRPHVTDRNGSTPIIYQSGYLDPLGRTLRVSLRKSF